MCNNLFRIIVLIRDGHQRQLAVMTSVVSRVMVSRSTYHCVRRDVSRQIVDTVMKYIARLLIKLYNVMAIASLPIKLYKV